MKLFADPMALVMFLAYLVSGIVMLAIYMQIYMWMTPYNNITAIKDPYPYSTISFAASMIGFTMPLVASSLYGASLLDFMVWGIIAAIVQLATYQLIKWKLGGTSTERLNGCIVYCAAMLCVGMINAVSLVP